jgi:hypothetical protein
MIAISVVGERSQASRLNSKGHLQKVISDGGLRPCHVANVMNTRRMADPR